MIEISIGLHPSKFQTAVVYLDKAPWRELKASLLKKNPFSFAYSSMKDWVEAWEAWEKGEVTRIAYDKLSRKRYFIEELKLALLKYGFSNNAVQDALSRLTSLGYLNDSDSVEAFVSQGIRKKKGPAWIAYKLRERGVLDQEVVYPEEVRESIIHELLLKHEKRGEKAIATLVRKGFSFNEVIQVYRKLNQKGVFR